MAEKRMFSRKITEDDNFMSLSSAAQALYFHLSMNSDDDGFCNQVAISMFKSHASTSDLEALIDKKYIYQYEDGVIVIKHWHINNAIRKDRRIPTTFTEHLKALEIKQNGAYTLTCQPSDNQVTTKCQPSDNQVSTEYRLDKVSIGKVSVSREDTPTLEEVKAYIADNNYKCDADKIFNYYTSKNWEGVKNWKARIDLWEKDDKQRRSNEIEQYDYDFDELERLLISNG